MKLYNKYYYYNINYIQFKLHNEIYTTYSIIINKIDKTYTNNL